MIESYLKITDDFQEMKEIALRLIKDVKWRGIKKFYTPLMLQKMRDELDHYMPDGTEEEKNAMIYRSIYDFWMYGATVDEEFYLQLKDMGDKEKRGYMVHHIRNAYVRHLNESAGPDKVEKLEDKYRCYQRLKEFYLRDVIEVRDESDLNTFREFAKKHSSFVVKPADYAYGYGVHKLSMEEFDYDYKRALDSILSEGNAIHEKHPSKVAKMVLEELIIQDESLAVLHPNSVNGIRVTAVRGKDGKIHVYHPWIKVGINGTFVASAALDGFDAEIDPVSGIVISDGAQENGHIYKVHPDSGITIKGFKIPKWKELLELVDALMNEMSEYGYIGWDLVLTPNGWCVMEANYSGEFTFQLINGRGYRDEFEKLIGWKYEKDFWWLDSENFHDN